MPILWAPDNPKIDGREVLAAMFEVDAELGIELPRPSFKREKQRFGEPMLKKVRQLVESVNDTHKGLLDLEQHGRRTFEGAASHPLADRLRPLIGGYTGFLDHPAGMPPWGLLTTMGNDPSTR